jgi:dipeptidyl aminopeptidase/acylaminoacyl peptidase
MFLKVHKKENTVFPSTGYLFVLLTLIVVSNLLNAATVEDFSKHPDYYNIKISPDGKHYAALADLNGIRQLVFLDAKTYDVTYALQAKSDSQPGNYYWVNNERVVVQVQQLRGALDAPLDYGELYGINYDGSKSKMIFCYRSKRGIALGGDAGFLVNRLKNEKKYVLIRKQSLTGGSDGLSQIIRLNVYTGKERKVRAAPISYARFLIDNNRVPRFVSGTDKDYNSKLFYTEGQGEKWVEFGDDFEGDFTPVSFSGDNKSIYALKSKGGETSGLYQYNIESGESIELYRSELVDPTDIMKSDLNEVFGIQLDEDYPSYAYLNENMLDAKLHKALFVAFKGERLDITSKTSDGRLAVVRVSGDRNPGAFYQFDTTTMSAKVLFNSAPWIKASELSPVEPLRIKSKDGRVLNGYMTLPKGKSKNLPLVVLPHGGPHARDYWEYHPQVQMLANSGYAVVQVNFRGSTGYGKNYMEAGYSQWGNMIQKDIIQATNYMIQLGIADPNRMCIFGASFGGYSALQSAILEPDMFKCAIGYAGVYDLPMLYKEGDIKTIKWGDAYLDKTLGTDKDTQIVQSPVYNVDKLKAPVFIIHGAKDIRAPIDHAEKLRKALEAKKHPYEWLVKEKEGHGFYDEENILEANKAILNFLDKHIGNSTL